MRSCVVPLHTAETRISESNTSAQNRSLSPATAACLVLPVAEEHLCSAYMAQDNGRDVDVHRCGRKKVAPSYTKLTHG